MRSSTAGGLSAGSATADVGSAAGVSGSNVARGETDSRTSSRLLSSSCRSALSRLDPVRSDSISPFSSVSIASSRCSIVDVDSETWPT